MKLTVDKNNGKAERLSLIYAWYRNSNIVQHVYG